MADVAGGAARSSLRLTRRSRNCVGKHSCRPIATPPKSPTAATMCGAPEVNGRHMPSRQPWNVPVSVACAVAACAIACAAGTPADPAGSWSGAEN